MFFELTWISCCAFADASSADNLNRKTRNRIGRSGGCGASANVTSGSPPNTSRSENETVTNPCNPNRIGDDAMNACGTVRRKEGEEVNECVDE